jgi:competence protein ComEC
MNPSLVFALFIIIGAFNGISNIFVFLLLLTWFILTKGSDFKYIMLSILCIGYLSFVHAIRLPNHIITCAKVITHYESGGILEIHKQRYRTFDSLEPNLSSFCATFSIKENSNLIRKSLDPITRAQSASRIMGSIKFKDISNVNFGQIERFKSNIRNLIFPEKDDDMFWMIHHSGLWLSSLLSIISSFLNLFFKKNKVNLTIHAIIGFFSWLMWDQRTIRLLLLSCARLLKIPHQKAQAWVFIIILLMFPYSIVSLSFLFPFVLFVVKSCRFKRIDYWIILIAFQQTVFASWSLVFIFSYSILGHLLWWSHLIQAMFPHLDVLNTISNVLKEIHHMFKISGGISGGTFFAFLGLVALTHRLKYWRLLTISVLTLFMIQPLRWLPQAHFINVGQGHATLFRYQASVLIDTGKANQSHYLKYYLNYHTVKSLDALIITHDDEDHAGGVDSLIEEKYISSIYPHKTTWSSNHWSITSLLDKRYEESNEDSGIYFIQLPNLKILVTGDAYHEQEKQLINLYHDLKVDVLLAGHHGSKTSTHPDFLAHINPKLVIISAQSSIYGHPHKETLRTLFKHQVLSYQLEEVGDLSIYCFPWFNLVLSSGGGFAIMR